MNARPIVLRDPNLIVLSGKPLSARGDLEPKVPRRLPGVDALQHAHLDRLAPIAQPDRVF